jgi:hypothetical protein
MLIMQLVATGRPRNIDVCNSGVGKYGCKFNARNCIEEQLLREYNSTISQGQSVHSIGLNFVCPILSTIVTLESIHISLSQKFASISGYTEHSVQQGEEDKSNRILTMSPIRIFAFNIAAGLMRHLPVL